MAFCGYCGSQMPDDMSFCTECGKPLIKKNNRTGNTDSNPIHMQLATQIVDAEQNEIDSGDIADEIINSNVNNTSDPVDDPDVNSLDNAEWSFDRQFDIPKDADLWTTSHLHDQCSNSDELYQSLKNTNAQKAGSSCSP